MITRIALTVEDLDRSVSFYQKVLNFKLVGTYTLDRFTAQNLFGIADENITVEVAALSLGEEQIELMQFHGTTDQDKIPADSQSNDLWFQHLALVVNNIETAMAHFEMFEVARISPAPQTLPDYLEAAGITAFYFKDPDGHVLELIHFPEDKIDPKWRNKPGEFLGIDHTAIIIGDTARSQAFYENLGMQRDSQTKNYGPEQEKLNQVEGTQLLITAMRFDQGPGIEFLDFKSPDDGRTFPKDAQPTDLIHWHTVIEVDNLPKIHDHFEKDKAAFISKTITRIEIAGQQSYHAFLIRDPDGHAVMLRQK